MEIKIGNHVLGENHPTYFIADISANHDGDLERAKLLIRPGKRCRCRCSQVPKFPGSTDRFRLRLQEHGRAGLAPIQVEEIGF